MNELPHIAKAAPARIYAVRGVRVHPVSFDALMGYEANETAAVEAWQRPL